MPRWLKIVLKILGGIIALVIVLLLAVTIYINSNKAKLLAKLNTKLNEKIDGSLSIGDISISLFKNFPHASLSLDNVLVRDKKWMEHHHTLLDAKDMDVVVDAGQLLSGTISIDHIDISNSAIYIYSDSTGYSNTSIFKKSNKPKTPSGKSSLEAELSNINLNNVSLTIDNQKGKKLFKFDVNQLKGKMDFPDSGWTAKAYLKVTARSLAFKTVHGSFIKDKVIEGDLVAGSNHTTGKINVTSKNFNIGGDVFKLDALFAPAKVSKNFTFHLVADKILWKSAASLVSPNISKTLYKFNLDKPISVNALISGNFSGGDPLLYITTVVRNNTLTIPGAVINDCNFDGMFTNNYVKGQELGDENSIINLYRLEGRFSNVPFKIDTASVINLTTPIAQGNFHARFPLTDLNQTFARVIKFNEGSADVSMRFKADVVALQINKPYVAGYINLNNANFNYIPRDLNLKNTSLSLHVNNGNLVINNIRVQSGRSVVQMEGRVNNFLNLYYNAPEKLIVNWDINSPQLHLAEFLGYLNRRKSAPVKPAPKGSTAATVDKVNTILDKSHAELHMHVGKVFYKKFLATNANADLLLSEDGIEMKNITVNHAGGALAIRGRILQDNVSNRFSISTVVRHVDIHEFFYAFDNFGLTAPTYKNLKGYLSAKAMVNGKFDGKGGIAQKSMTGNVLLNLTDGALIDFNPLKTIGKIAFPFRDLNNIEIPNLDGDFDINGDKITIKPMQISSSVINADVEGVYSLGRGTNVAIDVPLRNPKKDLSITDKAERQKKRYKGIVIHVKAQDDGTGKVKMSWNKDHKKT
ncbi:AsmA-like C-terminal region-containing protein [Mucilaginibacter agri]|uniref:AsmA family protein n=1 Tax=Mucilaginibacter agri TaxID=2695265 RepID=A0A966DR47_9SPHI|nr:AsmA-like C-terminal region-containing protein [Mucilaginibacter agri]NCD68110.1 AsmA family protein [Mucilaginibacter agri]